MATIPMESLYEISEEDDSDVSCDAELHVCPAFGPSHAFSCNCWCRPHSERQDNGNLVWVHEIYH